jgi:hypothetical protein
MQAAMQRCNEVRAATSHVAKKKPKQTPLTIKPACSTIMPPI